MSNKKLSIGALASSAECTVPTIGNYEGIGLMPHARRSANGHRYYDEPGLRCLAFIRRCRDLGFPIEQVKELTQLFQDADRGCVEVRDPAKVRLHAVRKQLDDMRKLEASLAAFVGSCDAVCAGGAANSCIIIEDLLPAPAGAGCCAPKPALTSAAEAVITELRRTPATQR